jgi:PTS hybrid protein
MSVGLVVVSHSAPLAEGVRELAEQMAPQVRVVPAGGLPDGAVGTDFEKVSAALSEASSDDGVALLYDLGSAQMTAELAVEALADPNSARVVDAPLVEGAIAAAVAAQGGSDLDAVARAAEEAARAPVEDEPVAAQEEPGEVREEIVLDNEVGLHARPAALLARSLAGLDAKVRVELGDAEADAASVLSVMGLGARKGDRVVLRGSGPDAQRAVRQIVELAQRNFDE